MKICLFGSYEKTSNGIPSGNGGELLKKILQTQNHDVSECHAPIKNYYSFTPAYVKLFFKHMKMNYEVMVIPWRGILTLPLAKLLCRKPIIIFPAFSIYDTLVNDRKKIKKKSFKAKIIHYIEKITYKMADLIILESSSEINYFIHEFNIPTHKFRKLPLSADESIFKPLPFKERHSSFKVFFFGTFIPLHGVDVIVHSAKILQEYSDIRFILCGTGQTQHEINEFVKQNGLTNVSLLGLVPLNELLQNLNDSDVCLGIFGSTEKSKKVLTNKVFQILASAKPLITMESDTTREANLKNMYNCLLVPHNSPSILAEAILYLKNNPESCKKISKEGYATFVQNMSMKKVGELLTQYINQISISTN